MACRPGPLRVGRSLRDTYTAFGVGLPLVGGTKIFASDQREPHPKGQIRVTK